MYAHHYESSARIRADAQALFDHVDDHARLSSHMSRSSWRMGGGRMTVDTDADRGRKVGSHIRLHGRVFGVPLALDEVVIERDPPRRKVWETVGQPRLLVIGNYRMGVDIDARGNDALLRVFIDYALPRSWIGKCLGRLFARPYARWCTERMAEDAVEMFGATRSGGTDGARSATE